MKSSTVGRKKILIASALEIGLLAGCSTIAKVGPPEQLEVKATLERIERGKYLAHHVAVCMDCHSTRDWSRFSGPALDGTWGKGGDVFDQKMGLPGRFLPGNITPAGIGAWSDGELFRAITGGVNRDNKALFPLMQYREFGLTDREDIYSIIAYIRSLPPIVNQVENSEADFPVNIILKTMPKRPHFQTRPDKSDKIAYGKYLTTMGQCIGCHTESKRGKRVGPEFAGGFKFRMPDGGVVYSKNITPDSITGIGLWNEGQFIGRFKIYADSAYAGKKIGKGEPQSPMSWTMYSGMTTEDLGAIYAYLRTVKPVKSIPPPPVFN